jgi:hypothetical protein
LTTFCTGTDLHGQRSWIDQSGNGNNATQATASKQPTIYTGGALVKQGGRITLDFDGGDFLRTSDGVANDEKLTFFGVHKQDRTNGYNVTFCLPANATTHTSPYFRVSQAIDNSPAGDIDYYINGLVKSSGFAYPTIQSAFSFNTFAGNSYLSGTQALNTTGALVTYPTSVPVIIGANTVGTEQFNGNFQEFMVYPSDKSIDRTSIEENIGDYFTQNTPLLDTYSGAAAAYSLRLLDSSLYVGSAIRVRRSSDNTEQDIGFNVFGELDTVSLTAFAGVGDAFCKVWYDQSGNSKDATQTTTASQPQIVSSGAVITENGKPAIMEYGGTYKSLNVSSVSIAADDGSFFAVNKPTTTTTEIYGYGGNLRLVTNLGRNGYFAGSSYIYSVAASSDQAIRTALSGTGANDAVAVNGSGLTTGSAGSSALTLTQVRVYSSFQEFIIYPSDESANRTGIETNVNTFYSIF